MAIFIGRTPDNPDKAIERIRGKNATDQGREMIGRRFAAVEPVLGDLRYNGEIDRFTLRGRDKVDVLWRLYCLVHNIGKLANHEYARMREARARRASIHTCWITARRHSECPGDFAAWIMRLSHDG